MKTEGCAPETVKAKAKAKANTSASGRQKLRSWAAVGLGGLALASLVWGAWFAWEVGLATKDAGQVAYRRRPPHTLVFTRDIAPIVLNRCAGCHRPGQSAPFSLLSYTDLKKRAKQILEVTQNRYMPPWLPEPGHGAFQGERRLTADELGLIEQWIAEGCLEGDPAAMPPLPRWTEGWQLGKPDLVIEMPSPYLLAADGEDV